VFFFFFLNEDEILFIIFVLFPKAFSNL